MNNSLQRDAFLSGEGDAWFFRNRRTQSFSVPSDDRLLPTLLELPLDDGPSTRVGEVGCGQGLRLQALAERKGWQVCGIDPSREAISAAAQLGVNSQVGTADQLPWADQSLDLLIFGFCLYLCDRDDLFKICAEAHRVLKPQAWLSILDFWSPYPHSNTYHHKQGIKSYKTDSSLMFAWHPDYVVVDHKIRHHSTHGYTDDANEWVAATVMRKIVNSVN